MNKQVNARKQHILLLREGNTLQREAVCQRRNKTASVERNRQESSKSFSLTLLASWDLLTEPHSPNQPQTVCSSASSPLLPPNTSSLTFTGWCYVASADRALLPQDQPEEAEALGQLGAAPMHRNKLPAHSPGRWGGNCMLWFVPDIFPK